MIREIRTETEIAASPAEVWKIFTDFASYPDWNPVLRIDGSAREGEHLEVRATPARGRPMTFHWMIAEVEPPRRLRMSGRSRIPGMMNSEGLVELSQTPTGTKLVRIGRYGGWIIPLVWRLRGASIETGFKQMDAALKQRAESSADPEPP